MEKYYSSTVNTIKQKLSSVPHALEKDLHAAADKVSQEAQKAKDEVVHVAHVTKNKSEEAFHTIDTRLTFGYHKANQEIADAAKSVFSVGGHAVSSAVHSVVGTISEGVGFMWESLPSVAKIAIIVFAIAAIWITLQGGKIAASGIKSGATYVAKNPEVLAMPFLL
jgi:hypothetical protein